MLRGDATGGGEGHCGPQLERLADSSGVFRKTSHHPPARSSSNLAALARETLLTFCSWAGRTRSVPGWSAQRRRCARSGLARLQLVCQRRANLHSWSGCCAPVDLSKGHGGYCRTAPLTVMHQPPCAFYRHTDSPSRAQGGAMAAPWERSSSIDQLHDPVKVRGDHLLSISSSRLQCPATTRLPLPDTHPKESLLHWKRGELSQPSPGVFAAVSGARP